MKKFNLTPDQQKIIDATSRNVLVSASAGSGKTATVIQKIFDLIANKGVDISSLLVITFTEAASSEMKTRLKSKLFEEAQNNHLLQQQIDKLTTSDISTIHSFCSKMLRKYFFKLDINPNFCVIDDNNAKFLKATALEKVITRYSNKNDQEFVVLSSLFGGGRTFAGLQSAVLSFYDFLCAVEDRENYKNNLLLSCYSENFDNNVACQVLNDYILSNFYYFSCSLKAYLDEAKIQRADYFETFICDVLKLIEQVKYTNSFLINHTAVFNVVLPKITTKKLDANNTNFKDEFKAFYSEMQKQIKEIKTLIINKPQEELVSDLQAAKKHLTKFVEIVECFDKEYSSQKQRRNALDFSDLEERFLQLLSFDDIRSSIAQSYNYIFVDEYQDINSVQELILSKLLDNNFMYMVGDVKQSIYGFRNSSPNIFVNKSLLYSEKEDKSGNHYKDIGQLITLNDNFRSNPEILNFVNAIFKKTMSNSFGGVDYENKGMLNGKTEYKKVDDIASVKLCICNKYKDDDEEEVETETFDEVYSVLADKNIYSKKLSSARRQAMVVAKNILDLIDKNIYDAKEDKTKKISFGDIAILGRSNDFLKEISNVLSEYKIPVSTNMADNIYQNKDVVALLSILKVINNSYDDIALSVTLTGFLANLTFDELATVKKGADKEDTLFDSIKKFVNNEENGQSDLHQKLTGFLQLINDLRFKLSSYMSIYELFYYLQDRYDYLNYFRSLPDGQNRYRVVKDYIDSFKDAEYNYDLPSYLSFVKSFAENARVSSIISSSPDSVKIGTIHSSKGLEYPIVFLVGADKPFSTITFRAEILKDKSLGLGISTFDFDTFEKKDNLAKNAISINLKKQEKAEELRLLYVALTRAKNHLIVVGHSNLNTLAKINNSKEAEGVNCFMPWIVSGLSDLAFKNLTENKKSFVDKNTNFNVDIEVFNDNDFEVEEAKNVDTKFLKKVKVDTTQFKKYFDYKFETKTDIAVKNTVSSMLQEYAEEGTSINLEPKQLKTSENAKEGIDASRLGTIYHKIMQRVDFSDKNCTTIEYLNSILDNLKLDSKYAKIVDINSIKKCIESLREFNFTWHKKEQPFLSYLPYNQIFKNSKITDKILIQGVADLIVKSNGKYILIDYKTTRVKTADQLVEKYKLQLSLYKHCLEKALNIPIDETLVYSFYLNKFVKII